MWLWSQVMGQCQPGSCHQAGHCHSHRNMCGDILEHDPCWRTCDMEKQELLPTLLDLVLEFHEWWSIAAYARNDNVLPHNTVGCCGVASVAWYSIILVHGNSLGSWDGTPLSFSNSYITLLLMWTTAWCRRMWSQQIRMKAEQKLICWSSCLQRFGQLGKLRRILSVSSDKLC